MRSAALLILCIAPVVSGCSAPREVNGRHEERLYLWLYGADDQVPPSIPGPVGKTEPASALRLMEAVRGCGADSIIVEYHGLGGEEISVPTTLNDRAVVECVRNRVRFGFNATRSTPSMWGDGQRGLPIFLYAAEQKNCAVKPADFVDGSDPPPDVRMQGIGGPLVNVVKVANSGAVTWNGADITIPRLEAYLTALTKLEPQPNTALDFDRGAPCHSIRLVRTMMRKHLNCAKANCLQGPVSFAN